MENILIVGPGRVGTALAVALKNAHHTVVGAVGRSKTSASCKRFENLGLGNTIGMGDTKALLQMITKTDILLLCVRDSDIAILADQLATSLPFRGNQLVCHTSGAMKLDVLLPFAKAGTMIGCLHPLQTFANPELGASKVKDTYFAVTGNEHVQSILMGLVNHLGGTPFLLSDNDKTRYHAGAALASNALVALIYTATSLMPLNCGLEALLPLIEGTIANLKQLGPIDALTGPIERGDIGTVLSHLKTIAKDKDAESVYKALGKVIVTVAREKGSLNDETKSHLLEILQDGREEE